MRWTAAVEAPIDSGGGGRDFRVGKLSALPNISALCTVAGTTVLGIHSGHSKNLLRFTLGEQKHSVGYSGIHRTHKEKILGHAPA